MADNVTLPGTGAVVAADEVGGAVYQRVKLAVGADGAAADLAPGQAAMADSLPVAIANNQSAVPVSGTVTVQDGGNVITVDGTVAVTNADLATVAGAVAGGHVQVDVLSGGGSSSDQKDVTFVLSLDTSAYHAGDVLADTQEIANALRVTNGTAELVSLVVNDEDDQAAAAMTLWFFSQNISLGTENAAPSITDANARYLVGQVTIPAAAWVDLGGVKVAVMPSLGLQMTGTAGSTSLYMAVTTAGTPTHSASGITGHLSFYRY